MVITIQMEANILTDWSMDGLLQTTMMQAVHLIEIDSVASDSVYTHVTLNSEIFHAKLDAGAQINVMTASLFKCIGKVKLPLSPKTDIKLVGYGNRNIENMGTMVLNVAHLNKTKKATFYVTKLNNDKVILGLWLCIDLQLISVHCDDKVSVKLMYYMKPRRLLMNSQLELTCSKHNEVLYHLFRLVPDLIVMMLSNKSWSCTQIYSLVWVPCRMQWFTWM